MTERPTKTSNYSASKRFNIVDYVRSIDTDLRQLFEKFRTIFSINKLQVGSDSDYATIGSGGMVTMSGNAQCSLKLRPTMVLTIAGRADEPTEVIRGANVGYSMYIWANAPVDRDQELYMRLYTPRRWNGIDDPQIGVYTSTIGAETVGKKFRFQMAWATTIEGSGTDTVNATVSTANSEITIPAGGVGGYAAFDMWFTLDADDADNPIVPGSMLQCRLRRIAASSNEIAGEVGVWDWVTHWRVDKMFGSWQVET